MPVADNGHPTEITIADPVQRTETLEQQGDYFNSYARPFEVLLFESLPGGLYDRILLAMLERKASLFVVTHR